MSKQKASPGSKESLRSICARFGGVSAHLISINMILYAFNKELCFRFPNTHFFIIIEKYLLIINCTFYIKFCII